MTDCVKCGGQLEQGFIPDADRNSFTRVSKWVEGSAEQSIWTGLKMKGRAQYDIVTWRCRRCGYLESYAR